MTKTNTALITLYKLYRSLLLLLIPIAVYIPPSPGIAFEHPGGLHTLDQLNTTAEKLDNEEQPWQTAWTSLVQYAEETADEQPSAVADFNVPAYSQNQSAHIAARNLLLEDAVAAYTGAMVYAVNAARSGTTPNWDRNANNAVNLLNDWASVNQGFSGPEGALVMSYGGVGLVQAAELIWNYPGWNSADKSRFQTWADTVLYSAAGIKNRPLNNSWNDWGILAALAIDNVTENADRLQDDIGILQELIGSQIDPNGRLPSSLQEGDESIVNTASALEALTAAVEIARNSGGPDLFGWNPPGGGTVFSALEFLFNRGIQNPEQWPVASAVDNSENNPRSDELFAAMGKVYSMNDWNNWADHADPDLSEIGFLAPTLLQPRPFGVSLLAGSGIESAAREAKKRGVGIGTKWKPGNYMRWEDDPTRGNTDGIRGITNFLQRNDIENFAGVQLQVNWATLEPFFRYYNWSIIDEALRLVTEKNKYLMVFVRDRTFHSGCSVIPSYAPTYRTKNGGCGTKLWEKAGADAYISFLKSMGNRYNSHPRFVAITVIGESSVAVDNRSILPTFSVESYREQLQRIYSETKKSFPSTVVNLGFNWPQNTEFMPPLFSYIAAQGGGGATWPDSVPRYQNSYLHYRLGKEYSNRIAIMPMTQAPHVKFTETEAIYQMLDNIGAHVIVWNNNHPGGLDYIGKQVIPTVNRHRGATNTSCPTSLAPCIR